MANLVEMSVTEFLAALASDSPTPGGGSASALASSMAAALVCMACNLTVGREKFREVEDELRGVLQRAQALQQTLTAAVDEDTAAYEGVSRAYKLPRGSDEEKRERARAIQSALQGASDVPLRVAQASAEVIELARIASEKSNPNVASDAAVAIMLAEAGRDGAIANVEINLGGIGDEDYVKRMRAELERVKRREDA